MNVGRVTALLEEWCEGAGVFGASAGIRRRDGQQTVVAWGVDGRNPMSPMPTSGTFRIASLTKTFTSALILDLVDRGELSLDSTIDEWLPTYPCATVITVRSLLEHTAGTADMIFDAFDDYVQLLLSDLDRRFDPDELVGLMGSLPVHGRPGESYRYSNTDYSVLGVIAERVSGVSFSMLLARRFTEPLGLRHTVYDDAVPDELLHGWFSLDVFTSPGGSPERDLDVRDFPNTALISLAFAAGGMTSTLTDLLSWAESLYLGAALSPVARAQLLASPELESPDVGRHGLGVYGYGERTDDTLWTAYGHTGNIVGSSAFIAAFPGSGTSIAIHANVQEVPSDKLVEVGFALAALSESDD